MDDTAERLQTLLFSNLSLKCPVLSGNMRENIVKMDSNNQIIIEAPFYDLKEWRKKGIIVHTGTSYNGMTDYALLVNQVGAFGKHNKSEGWVNRAILDVVIAFANEIGAEVIYEL